MITDFGAPKVIGGQYNVLATDVYKQVIGQQNFEMGAVVSVLLMIPAILAFAADRIVQRRQVALLSARAVPYEAQPGTRFDLLMLAYCVGVAIFLVGLVAVSQFAALVKFFPYNLPPYAEPLRLRHQGRRRVGLLLELDPHGPVHGGDRHGGGLRGRLPGGEGTGPSLGPRRVQFLAMIPMAVPRRWAACTAP